MKNETKAKAPIATHRAGSVKVAIWKNTGKNENGKEYTIYSASIVRSYKDKNDEWQDTNSYNLNDIPKAIYCLQRAYEHMIVSAQEKDDD